MNATFLRWSHSLRRRLAIALPIIATLLLASFAHAQEAVEAASTDAPTETRHSLIDFVTSGGVVGYVIIALSVVAVGMVVDIVLRTKRDKLVPDGIVRHSLELAEHGRINELLAMTRASDTVFGRIVSGALERGRLGIDAVKQEMQQLGEAEILRLRTRVGHIGVVATAGPMLGLLGTVIGMIDSFSVLGTSKNAARPDELAAGISVALITTCEGLILAVPLIFVHGWLRDRVTKVSQELAHAGERLLGTLAITATRRPGPQQQQQPMSQQPPQRVTTTPPSVSGMSTIGPAPAVTSGAFGNAPPNTSQGNEPSFSGATGPSDLGGLQRG